MSVAEVPNTESTLVNQTTAMPSSLSPFSQLCLIILTQYPSLFIFVGPHFGPGLGLEDKPEPGSSFCSLVGEPKPGLSFETCLSHFSDSARPVWPCLCPTVADVELCHWPCQSLHMLCHSSLPSMSSYPAKKLPPYVLNLYKQETDAWCVSFGL